MIKKLSRSRRSNDRINWAQATSFFVCIAAIAKLALTLHDVSTNDQLSQLQSRIAHLETRACK